MVAPVARGALSLACTWH